MKLSPLITCEHAGNWIPPEYANLFEGAEEVLQSHAGWDPGALEIAGYLAESLSAPLFICKSSRLLIEPNRSLTSSSLFSRYTRELSLPKQEELLRQIYFPYRTRVESCIRESEHVLHLSVHTFTPVFNGDVRNVDIGILFDPARENESAFCADYIRSLRVLQPSLTIELNTPYKGTDDGFTTHLRTLFEDAAYLGIELEVNQKYVGTKQADGIRAALTDALKELVS